DPGSLQPGDLLDATLRQPVRRLVGGQPLLRSHLEEVRQCLVDLARLAPGAVRIPAVHLSIDVDHATGVDHVVRRIEDALLRQHVAMPLLAKLVVRGARDDLEAELRDRRVIDDGTECARREDLRLDAIDLVRRNGAGAQLVDHVLHALRVDVGDDELRTDLVQIAAQVAADVTEPLYCDGDTLEVVRAELVLRGGLDAAEHTPRRDRRRVAETAGQAGDVARLHLDVAHVLDARAHVLGGDVAAAQRLDEAAVCAEDHLAARRAIVTAEHGLAAAQRLDEAAVCAEDHLALRRAIVTDDHGLAAAQVETGDGSLVRHSAREAEYVDDCLFLRGVVPEARAAKRRAERRVVYRDDPLVADARLVAEDKLLVLVLAHRLEDFHDSPRHSVYGPSSARRLIVVE